jgi:hypothetical protein
MTEETIGYIMLFGKVNAIVNRDGKVEVQETELINLDE